MKKLGLNIDYLIATFTSGLILFLTLFCIEVITKTPKFIQGVTEYVNK
jgi:hypothetical protein